MKQKINEDEKNKIKSTGLDAFNSYIKYLCKRKMSLTTKEKKLHLQRLYSIPDIMKSS